MTVEEQVQEQILCGQNFFRFCHDILGYTDMLDVHEQLCGFLQAPGGMKLILMPRYTFKSCLCTIGYALWRLVRDDSLRILIYSDTSTKAESFLTSVKNHIAGVEKGSRFREVYGEWETDPKRGVWNQSQIVIRPRQHAHAEPSVDTGGIETSKVGMHYDLILFDDIVSDVNVTTPEQMQKVKECYRKALSLLKPGGEVILTGTRWHFGDLYGQLVAQPPQGLQTLIRKAEVEGDYPFAKIGLTQDFCAQKRDLQGSYHFSCLYQNDPVDDETAIFKVRDFAFYQPQHSQAYKDWVSTLSVTCCVDPAISQAQDADSTAITVVGTDREWNLYLLDATVGHLLPDETIEEVLSLSKQWRFHTLGMETNSFQRILKRDLERRLAQERTSRDYRPFSVVEFTGVSTMSKQQRIQGLQPYHERKAIHLPGERLELLQAPYSTLAYQMQQFPHAAHDDILDSLAYHLQIFRQGTDRPVVTNIPYTSAAWYERELQKEELVVMAKRPRWQRRTPLPLTFS